MKKVQNLNEEIQKMRRLMSFSINENSHDSLSEENINKSIKGSKIDPEEQECDRVYGGPPEVAFNMSDQLNILLTNALGKIKEQTKVTIVAKSESELYFQIGDKQISLELDPESAKLGYTVFEFASKGGAIPFATDLPVSLFKEELLKDRCFRLLYDRYDSIKNQIDNEKISMKLVPTGYEGEGDFGVKMFLANSTKQLKKSFKKGTNKFVNWEKANLLDFDSPFYIKLNKGLYGKIEADWGVELTRIEINGAELPKEWGEPDNEPNKDKCYCDDVDTGEKVEYPCGGELPERCKDGGNPVVFDFVVEANKNFEFDDAILTQEAKDKIDSEIVEKWNKIPEFRKEQYLEFLKDKTITVNAYSSIDALSNFPDGGRYSGCSKYGVGKGPRVKYNECLSQARAEAVVEYLKTIADGAFKDVNFEAVGKGETNQFSGLVWDNNAKPKIVNGSPVNVKSPFTTDQTKSDRRFEVKFPYYRKED